MEHAKMELPDETRPALAGQMVAAGDAEPLEDCLCTECETHTFDNIVSTSCDCNFHKHCIEQALEREPRCPKCGEDLPAESGDARFKPVPQVIVKMLKKTKVRCVQGCKAGPPEPPSGARAVTQLRFEEHGQHVLNDCRLTPFRCDGCNKVHERWEALSHSLTCGQVLIDCGQQCGERVKRSEMQDHMRRLCRNRSVPCDRCAEQYVLSRLDAHLEKCPATASVAEVTQLRNLVVAQGTELRQLTERQGEEARAQLTAQSVLLQGEADGQRAEMRQLLDTEEQQRQQMEERLQEGTRAELAGATAQLQLTIDEQRDEMQRMREAQQEATRREEKAKEEFAETKLELANAKGQIAQQGQVVDGLRKELAAQKEVGGEQQKMLQQQQGDIKELRGLIAQMGKTVAEDKAAQEKETGALKKQVAALQKVAEDREQRAKQKAEKDQADQERLEGELRIVSGRNDTPEHVRNLARCFLVYRKGVPMRLRVSSKEFSDCNGEYTLLADPHNGEPVWGSSGGGFVYASAVCKKMWKLATSRSEMLAGGCVARGSSSSPARASWTHWAEKEMIVKASQTTVVAVTSL
eukprot:TRINITY_DN518_c0_g1_i6.p1 TRINITY_DN518_c0_g1~~TRINITY_DN518_c0_g1_i6.p1  ORF type:complete len:608 (+),score=247.97 TRINITY_DN518_c0_g1_i6:90-1826(+)